MCWQATGRDQTGSGTELTVEMTGVWSDWGMLSLISVAHNRRSCEINTPWGWRRMSLSQNLSQCLMPCRFCSAMLHLTCNSTGQYQQITVWKMRHIFNFAGVSLSWAFLTVLIFLQRWKDFPEDLRPWEKPGMFICCLCVMCCRFWNGKSLSKVLQEGTFWIICALGEVLKGKKWMKTVIHSFCHYVPFAKAWVEVTPTPPEHYGSEFM